jgi:hypothetical protein
MLIRTTVCLSLSYPLALPTAAFSTNMAKPKVTAEELLARAEYNGYKRGPPPKERQHSRRQETHRQDREGSKCGVGLLCPLRDQNLTAAAKIGADTP